MRRWERGAGSTYVPAVPAAGGSGSVRGQGSALPPSLAWNPPRREQSLVYKFSLCTSCDKKSSRWFCGFPLLSAGLPSGCLLIRGACRTIRVDLLPNTARQTFFLPFAGNELAAVRGGSRRSPGLRRALCFMSVVSVLRRFLRGSRTALPNTLKPEPGPARIKLEAGRSVDECQRPCRLRGERRPGHLSG